MLTTTDSIIMAIWSGAGAIEIRSCANHVLWPLAGKISPIFRVALETSVYYYGANSYVGR